MTDFTFHFDLVMESIVVISSQSLALLGYLKAFGTVNSVFHNPVWLPFSTIFNPDGKRFSLVASNGPLVPDL